MVKKTWTVPELARFKKTQEHPALTMVTVYDATAARWCAASDVDFLLVGDSLGMVIQGADNTLGVTLADMVYHVSCVRRGAPDAFIVGDLPFGSYQSSESTGVDSAVALMRAGATMVKLEGAWDSLIQKLVFSGIPVMGHLGLTPQSVSLLGGFKQQAREPKAAEQLKRDAQKLEAAGCSALVLESIPRGLASEVTQALSIPTIGIGAGADVDGQVLVLQDLLGMNLSFHPKFVKQFSALETEAVRALNQFCVEVRQGAFPGNHH